MTGTWKKLKMAFGTRMCLHLPRVAGDSTPSSNVAPMSSEAVSPMGSASNCRQSSPIHSSSSSRVSKSGSRSSRVMILFSRYSNCRLIAYFNSIVFGGLCYLLLKSCYSFGF